MALLNRLFPTKKKNLKQGYVPFGKSDHSGNWKPFNFSRDQVRLLLFRECDARGRKLLFDSGGVQKTVLENQQCSKFKLGSKSKCDYPKKTETYVEVTNGVAYQYTKPGPEVTLMGEMVFGSVAMTFKGMTCKVHYMKSPDRFMCSRVFHTPSVYFNSKRKSDQSIDSSGSSVNSLNDSLFSLSGSHETKLTLSNSSGPLDVPCSEASGKAAISSLEGDSGFCGDASLRSLSSVGSGFWGPIPYGCDSSSGSHSTLGNSSNSGGSLASLQRRWMKNVSTSLERGVACSPWHFLRGRNSIGLSDEVSSRSNRKTQLGLTVVINIPSEEEKDMEIFFFEHIAVVEGMLERLQSSVERAYVKKDVFVHMMMDAFYDLQQWLCDLFTAPRLVCPVWIGLVSPEHHGESSRVRCGVMTMFLRDLCQLIAAIDTKATNFFISTLVTAVLTHHLGWVATIMPAKAPPNCVTKPPCAVQMLHALAKSHPYNALWAQLGDLHGALGNPVKIARTVITANGKKSDLLNKLLTSLSYFIRSGNVEKRVESEIVVGSESNILDSVMENFSCVSLNSSTASASTIVPDNSTKFGNEDPKTLLSGCRVENDSKRTSSEAMKENLFNQKTCSLTLCKVPLTDSSSVSNFKKSNSYMNCLNLSSEVDSSSCQNLKSNLYPDLSNIESEYLHPDLSNIESEYLHPDVISEKVSRLCRVPTNAVLYHLKNDDQNIETVKNFLPKKVDCEKQLSSVHSENKRKCAVSLSNSVLENTSKERESSALESSEGVVFVLGDNEQLIDLKNQNGVSIPKSKSDDIICIECINSQTHGLKSNCYPSLQRLTESQKKTNIFEVNATSVRIKSPNSNGSNSARTGESAKMIIHRRSCSDSFVKCCSNLEETGLDYGIVLDEEPVSFKPENCEQDFVCEKVNKWKNERTNIGVYDNHSCRVTGGLFLEDINGNPRTDVKEHNPCKVVTSRSFVIELEDVNGCPEVQIPNVGKKLLKNVARSQSLSFPDRKSVTCKKTVSICRRHSENMHANDRYLKDYHSVRFNFERCDGVLSDYVDGIGVDKSPQPEKKAIKISEARGNFELQDKMCEKCGLQKGGISVQPVLHDIDVCDCAYKSSFSKEHGFQQGSLNAEGVEREGNALFDDYGTLSDDELLSSTKVCVKRETETVSQEIVHHPSLIELPLPWYNCSQQKHSGLAASLLGGVSDHYMPDMVLHGCTQALPYWETILKHDLAVSAHRPMLDQEVSEAVCIVGNAELWEVQLVSSHVSVVDKPGGFGIRVGMSQLVANMLESLLHLWKLRTPPEQCLQHLESKLRELCLRSQALAELLLTTELCDMATLTSALGLEANDIPLLLAIASTHTPQVTNLYGLNFR